MTIEYCMQCNNLARFFLSFNVRDLDLGVSESLGGYYCKEHFVERLKSMPEIISDIAVRCSK